MLILKQRVCPQLICYVASRAYIHHRLKEHGMEQCVYLNKYLNIQVFFKCTSASIFTIFQKVLSIYEKVHMHQAQVLIDQIS